MRPCALARLRALRFTCTRLPWPYPEYLQKCFYHSDRGAAGTSFQDFDELGAGTTLSAERLGHASQGAKISDARQNSASRTQVLLRAQNLAQTGRIYPSCKLVIDHLDFTDALEFFIAQYSQLKQSNTYSSEVYEITYILCSLGNSQLAAQALKGAGVGSSVMPIVELIVYMSDGPCGLDDIDAGIFAATGIHFPQILGHTEQPHWLRLHALALLAFGDPRSFETNLLRYSAHFLTPASVRTLVLANEQVFGIVLRKLVTEKNRSPQWFASIETLCHTCDEPRKFRSLWRKLKKLELPGNLYSSLLSNALRLKLSYDIVSVAVRGADFLSVRSLSEALLAAAWSQKRDTDTGSGLTLANDVQTSQVVRLLNALSTRVDAVLLHAICRLSSAKDSVEAPRVLWSLILGLDESNVGAVKPQVVAGLVRIMAARPHLEQIRFMALKTVQVPTVLHLTRHNIKRVAQLRANEATDPKSLQNDADVQLVLGGILLMSEKSLSHGRDSGLLSKAIRDVFDNFDPQLAATLMSTFQEHHKPSPSALVAIMGMLVKNNSYAMAIQVLHKLQGQKIPPRAIESLILKVCSEFPDISVQFVTWLIKRAKVFVSPELLRRMIISLSLTEQLSDHQITHRVSKLVSILRGLSEKVDVAASAAIVDGLLHRAAASGRGSKRRLQWALNISRLEGVPPMKVKEWLNKVQYMRNNGQGYWARRR